MSTTGRRLNDEQPADGISVLVLPDGNCAFKVVHARRHRHLLGCVSGTADEILLSGRAR